MRERKGVLWLAIGTSSFTVAALACPAPSGASELSSASFRMLGTHVGSVGAAALVATGPRYGGAGVALGQSDALGFAGSGVDLTTHAPGFWPVVAAAFPTLDVDGDGDPAWNDDDDDDDGLPDVVESRTGVFVSADDTGTDPQDPDSDGDGLPDGAEVGAGTDPLDPLDPEPAPVPVGPLVGSGLLVGILGAAALRLRHGARTERGAPRPQTRRRS